MLLALSIPTAAYSRTELYEMLVFFTLLYRCSVNVSLGPREDRLLITGLHTVADIMCTCCGTVLGWKYVRPAFPSTLQSCLSFSTAIPLFKCASAAALCHYHAACTFAARPKHA